MNASQPPPSDSTAQRQSTQQVRAEVAELNAIADRARVLLGAPEALRDKASQLFTALVERRVDAELDDMDLGDLKDALPPRTPLRPLKDAGYRTVGSVLKTSEHRLAAVKGAGEKTVRRVRGAARTVKQEVTAEVRFRFDPDRPDEHQTGLLAVLAAILYADAGADEIGKPLRELIGKAERLTPRTRIAAGPVRRLLARRASKQASFEAVTAIETTLLESRQLVTKMDRIAHRTAPDSRSPDRLWKAFRNDAASFYAVLSGLDGSATRDQSEAARGYLDDEFARQVADVRLDTSLLRATLHGYQRFGAQYALHRKRAMIGDEMGLGKTVQALAACAHLAAKGQNRFLVVCPKSVLFNWLAEIEKHTRLSAYKLHGQAQEREEAGLHWLRHGGVAVTTFDTLGRLKCLAGVNGIAMLVVDEAHYVKNPKGERARTLRPFLDRSDRVLFLTGTPMENRVDEFRQLVLCLRPRAAEGIRSDVGVAGAKSFRRKVAKVYLRRNQEDVLTELPPRIEVDEWVQFTEEDSAVYRAAVQSGRGVAALEPMRKAAYVARNSAKLERVCELVDEAVEDGRKVLVFSHYLNVIERIRNELGTKVLGTITGAVSAAKRRNAVDDFTRHEGSAVLLAQIKTGGEGVNIPAASVVIITEPDWTPTKEDQAIGRAHRKGQTRTVQVHRMLAKGSIDEWIVEVQHGKRRLFNEFARKSDAKDADRGAVDASRPAVLDNDSIPLKERVVQAERDRLNL